jgi:hypothetical protein
MMIAPPQPVFSGGSGGDDHRQTREGQRFLEKVTAGDGRVHVFLTSLAASLLALLMTG